MIKRHRSTFHYEKMREPLAPPEVFRQRILASTALTGVVLALSLALGMAGYHWLVGIPHWVDCLYSASMIMGGMGPVGPDPDQRCGQDLRVGVRHLLRRHAARQRRAAAVARPASAAAQPARGDRRVARDTVTPGPAVPCGPRTRHAAMLPPRERPRARTRPALPRHEPDRPWFDGEDAPHTPELHTCIHCGLCLTACPTYRTLKIEPDSPRGRLYLMRGLAEGRISPSDPLVGHLDRCLDCRACETVCPAGVPYSRLLEATRGQLARRWRRASPLRTLGHWVLRTVLPHAGRVELAADLLRIGQAKPLAALLATPLAQRLLPRFAKQGLAMTPRAQAAARACARACRSAAAGRRAHGTAARMRWCSIPPAPPRATSRFTPRA